MINKTVKNLALILSLSGFLFISCGRKKHSTSVENIYALYPNGIYLGGGAVQRTIKDTMRNDEIELDTFYLVYFMDTIRKNGIASYDSINKTWMQIKVKPIDKHLVKEVDICITQ